MNTAEKLVERGIDFLGQKNYSAALSCLEEAKERDSTNPNIFLTTGVIFFRMGKAEEALDNFLKIKDNFRHFEVRDFIAKCYLMIDLKLKALSIYQELVEEVLRDVPRKDLADHWVKYEEALIWWSISDHSCHEIAIGILREILVDYKKVVGKISSKSQRG